MIGNNIKFYRLMRRMSQEKLARLIGVSKMAISYYESDKRMPDYDILIKISDVLGVSCGSLLTQSELELKIKHGAFRKQSTMSKQQQQVIFEIIDRYIKKIYEVVSYIGDCSLPPIPLYERKLFDDYNLAGQYLRQILGISLTGPVGNITDMLENKGFIICPVNYEHRSFSGNSGFIDDRPYIAINIKMPLERQRFTLIHELVHLIFEIEQEHIVDSITGAFLFPENDVIREFGPKRKDIRGDLRNIQREYGISMEAVVIRAYQTQVISKNVYEITMKWMSANDLRGYEGSGHFIEKTHLLEHLISRAVGEDEIGISKAAELLEVSLLDARKLCYGTD